MLLEQQKGQTSNTYHNKNEFIMYIFKVEEYLKINIV
jgi:hypothetical protein